jgi:hypothetical protein
VAIVNRRNAFFGWVVWSALKTFGKQKARAAAPGRGDYAGLNKSAVALVIGATIGTVVAVALKKSGGSASE